FGILDLDDIGTHLPQGLAGHRGGDVPGELDHPHAVERAAHGMGPRSAGTVSRIRAPRWWIRSWMGIARASRARTGQRALASSDVARTRSGSPAPATCVSTTIHCGWAGTSPTRCRSEEHTSELQS